MNLQYKKIEKVVKSFANHRRIQILNLLTKNPDLSVDQIAQNLNVNFVTIADHIRKLSDAGLVDKKHKGHFVINSITNLGKRILLFCKKLK